MLTVLQNLQDVAIETGEPAPSAVVGTTDITNLQLFAFMNRIGDMLVSEHDWQALTKGYQFSTVGYSYVGGMVTGSNLITMANTSGLTTDFDIRGDGIPANSMITSIVPNVSVSISNNATKTQSISLDFGQVNYPLPSDFHHLVPDTSYDQGNKWPMSSVTAQGWNYLKSGWLSGNTRVLFRLLGGDKFSIFPSQSGQRTFTFEYISKNYVTDLLGVAKNRFTADDDVCVFPDCLMVMGCKLKFWQQKGFDSTILDADFSRELAKYKGQQAASQALNMGGLVRSDMVLNIPEGNFG